MIIESTGQARIDNEIEEILDKIINCEKSLSLQLKEIYIDIITFRESLKED